MARNRRGGFRVAACRQCGCTDADCSGCIERTGFACYWVEADLCSACVESTPALWQAGETVAQSPPN